MALPAILYGLFILGVIFFQIALISGAPWGHLTQGGGHAGALPAGGRIIAGISILLLAAMALAMFSAAGHWPGWPIYTGWAAVVFNGVIMGLNWATPSAAERRLWGPITTLMFLLALSVMLWR